MTEQRRKEAAFRLSRIEERIRAACERSARPREDVTLVAVSKTKPAEDIRLFYGLGLREFGENRPQELRDKEPVLPDDIRWHMIGHLQRNKVKYVVGRAELIHSVDSLEIAQAVSDEAVKQGLIVPVLAEVNVAEEETKFGVRASDCEAFIRQIATLPGITIRGLMTIAPFVDDAEENRPVFRKLRQLSVDIGGQNIDNVSMYVLSMGMTNDFEVAIEEGATMVRIGTALFGERNKTT